MVREFESLAINLKMIESVGHIQIKDGKAFEIQMQSGRVHIVTEHKCTREQLVNEWKKAISFNPKF